MKVSAKPLIESCTQVLSQQIQTEVENTITLWNDSQKNLEDLCIKYQNTVELWSKYNNDIKAVKQWIDDPKQYTTKTTNEEIKVRLIISFTFVCLKIVWNSLFFISSFSYYTLRIVSHK